MNVACVVSVYLEIQWFINVTGSKAKDVTTLNREVPYLYEELVLLPKFDNSSSSVTRDKEICQIYVIMRWWSHYLLRQSTQWNPLYQVYLLSKFDVSSFSMIRDYETGIFLASRSSKFIAIFLTLGKSKLTPNVHLYHYWVSHSYFTDSEQDFRLQKTIQAHCLTKKSRTRHSIWYKSFSVIQSARVKNWFPINK